jgi:enamine deaminase RidA (YjgF/YER057c/UK114 family)
MESARRGVIFDYTGRLATPSIQDSTMTIERRNVGKRLSDLVIYAPPPGGRLVYLAGQVAEDPKADIDGQTRSVLKQVDRLLDEAGTDKTRILSATIYLADMSDYAAMNAVWDAWVPQGETPARATVEARLANPAYRVEMQIVAAAG